MYWPNHNAIPALLPPTENRRCLPKLVPTMLHAVAFEPLIGCEIPRENCQSTPATDVRSVSAPADAGSGRRVAPERGSLCNQSDAVAPQRPIRMRAALAKDRRTI